MRELVPAKIVEETLSKKGTLEAEEKRVDALTSELTDLCLIRLFSVLY